MKQISIASYGRMLLYILLGVSLTGFFARCKKGDAVSKENEAIVSYA